MERKIAWRAAKDKAEERTQSGPPWWRLKLPWPHKQTTVTPWKSNFDAQGEEHCSCVSGHRRRAVDATSSQMDLKNSKLQTHKNRAWITHLMISNQMAYVRTSSEINHGWTPPSQRKTTPPSHLICKKGPIGINPSTGQARASPGPPSPTPPLASSLQPPKMERREGIRLGELSFRLRDAVQRHWHTHTERRGGVLEDWWKFDASLKLEYSTIHIHSRYQCADIMVCEMVRLCVPTNVLGLKLLGEIRNIFSLFSPTKIKSEYTTSKAFS